MERGERVIHFGEFLELFKDGGRYVVQSWDVDSVEIWRYCFVPGPAGQPWPLACIEDVTGQGLDLHRDATGRLTAVRQRLEKRTLLLEYNSTGFIETLIFQGANGERQRLARYEYDGEGRLNVAYDAAGNAEHYEDDKHGRIVREIGKDGSVVSYSYDPKGRCTRFSGLDRYDEKHLRFIETARVTEKVDSYGRTTLYQYMPNGQIITEWNPIGGESTKKYDEAGRITAETTQLGATTHYEYDEMGNRCKIVDPLGNTTFLAFNESHQPTIIRDPNGNLWKREDRSAQSPGQ